ncbi:hypothetical protein C8R42DRAFT_643780 [Lentinula raphanica]|nr:hypothetical protein C8R42DRAFT_643780 [Lentinula raphanica]
MATNDDLEGVGVGGKENEEDTDHEWDNTLKSISVLLASSKEQMNRKRVKEGRVTNVAQGPTLNLVGPQRVFEGMNEFEEEYGRVVGSRMPEWSKVPNGAGDLKKGMMIWLPYQRDTYFWEQGSSSRIIFTVLFERSDTATSSTKRRDVVRDFLIGLRVEGGREGRGISEQRTGISMGDLG